MTLQILLSGEKEWLVEENRNIRNPLASFHPIRDRRGEWIGMQEEAYADDTAMPRAFAAGSQLVRAVAGTAMFLPRSVWHETRSLTDTWSVNIVIRSATRARALGRAMEIWLHRDPAFRAYCEGVVHGGRTLGTRWRHRRARAQAGGVRLAAAPPIRPSFSSPALTPLLSDERPQRPRLGPRPGGQARELPESGSHPDVQGIGPAGRETRAAYGARTRCGAFVRPGPRRG